MYKNTRLLSETIYIFCVARFRRTFFKTLMQNIQEMEAENVSVSCSPSLRSLSALLAFVSRCPRISVVVASHLGALIAYRFPGSLSRPIHRALSSCLSRPLLAFPFVFSSRCSLSYPGCQREITRRGAKRREEKTNLRSYEY